MTEINIKINSSQYNNANENKELTLDFVQHDFLEKLTFLNNPQNLSIMNTEFYFELERALSTDRELYKHPEKIANLFQRGIEKILGKTTSNDIAKDLLKEQCSTPLGIFNNVLQLNISDIFIVYDRISFSGGNNESAKEIIVPSHLLRTFHTMTDRFINLTLYASKVANTKFDPTNAILDYNTEKIRFNVVHSSLNASGKECAIVALRKQIVAKDDNDQKEIDLPPDYINQIGATQNQIDFIKKLAFDGSYMIFGETGSGKTTLLKYMGNYKVKDKRNLITIEDTPELFLPINIAYLTNDKFSIQDIFKIVLRENPSHVLIGETRGPEVVDALENGLVFRIGTTLHADSLAKFIMRVNFMSKASRSHYETNDIERMLTATLDGIIHMKNRKIAGMWKRADGLTIQEHPDQAIKNYIEVE